ncbi:elongation factor G [Lactobacillus hamsteri DSM 5661 = JCM 6256]|uniref:Elongation factor G n=2 Tax=Lactobacillus hamsteri TaxID=96565 RepID=A0A0R1Y8J0_9LACO|nr:elongation factor G [Lactobacillus hamsteri DSM 5661 = JCM 6256]
MIILKKIMIGVIGKTGSGKTSLINSFSTISNHEFEFIDTPGTLALADQIEEKTSNLDYAIFVLPANEKFSGESFALWQLLKYYQIPTFIFINKVDLKTWDKKELDQNLKEQLGSSSILFNDKLRDESLEEIALQDEVLLDKYIKDGHISEEDIRELIAKRKVYPYYVGSALNRDEISTFFNGIKRWYELSNKNKSSKTQRFFDASFIYTVKVKEDDISSCIKALRKIENENPRLNVKWIKQLDEIQVNLMGDLAGKVLEDRLKKDFNIQAQIVPAQPLYKETVNSSVEGVGHYSPLRHYSEVHLIIESGKRGSGITFDADCPWTVLPRNWQEVVHQEILTEEIPGVLIGAPIIDLKFTLIGGISNLAHSGSEDFRKSTRRAVRQGLMQLKAMNQCQLLEPFYRFKLILPEENVGQAIQDISQMSGEVKISDHRGSIVTLTGMAPVSEMQNYQKKVSSYTHGLGYLSCVFAEYRNCHNASEVIESYKYDPENDINFPIDSVFCLNKINTQIRWDQVDKYCLYPMKN